ncbi:PepSY domain-containing protein [Methylobacillus arboreus]|uniref:PepSY-associated TM helix domain-containing protein n=1 Tax=Methylobacillus arboreus TaxID=755170 RepID=UPI001E41091D|nr:PepSY-associated TM helix domain-containing protein [Methylobacillus arboreus]MCB5190397.1 PepSY domain-containing protein [Methylobacillus arboreus]
MANNRQRILWLRLHLYLGLSLGALFVLMGLTGSLLVFYTKLDSALNPQIQVTGPVSSPSPQAILEQLHKAYPERTAGWRIEMPLHGDSPVLARYLKPIETRDRHFAPLMVTLDPQTLQASSSRFWGDTAMTWLYDLHYTLLLDVNGKNIIAIASIFILVSLASGIYLWWPQNGNFRLALTYRRQAHFYRRVYDWHKLCGVYGLVLLAMLTITGIMLEQPDWFEGWLGAKPSMLHMGSAPTPKSGAQPAPPPGISMDTMAHIAMQQFPGSELRWIYTPDSADGDYQFRLYQPGEPGKRFPKTIVFITHDGKVAVKRDYFADNSGSKVMHWLHPLHNGEAFGLAGRWLVFASGFMPLVLFVTGWMRWRHKRRAARMQQRRDYPRNKKG